MPSHTRPQLLVIWVIWFSMFVAVFIYQFALGGGIPVGDNAHEQKLDVAVIISAAMLLAALPIRWLLIPRANAAGKILVLMIIGLALSEAVEFQGLFLVSADQPGTKRMLWILSLASIVQFAPIYALSSRQKNPFHEG